MPEVVESMVLFGEYDAYCKIVMPDFSTLSTFILRNIRTIDGVISTTTLTAATNQQ
jgi:DNA-binding Lrp family transcriptional regulator